METSVNKFNLEINKLNDEQKQVLKDTINFGYWGNCDFEFKNEKGEWETVGCNGYVTNEAKKANHFQGRKISGLFSSIYRKLIDGGLLNHASNWWGDGSGDVLFIRESYVSLFKNWAKGE